ncbi:phage portal protein family protein [Flavobacterium sp. TMP13]|uniref:phage portal protein family protein n=1 Tax=Flavobacterium sp. TMP13 TaxID=3425950 RepID=UPI003D789CF4
MSSRNKNIASAQKRVSTVSLSGNAIAKKVNLSSADAGDITKITNLMVDVIRRQRRLWRKEINDWQAARYAYYQSDIPRFWPMQEVYDDILLDGHLTAVTEDRTLRTINEDFIFSIDGIKDDKLTNFIEDQEWFDYVLEEAHKTTFKGEAYLWIKDFEKGAIKEVELIDRGLVVPGQKILLYDINGNKGLDVSEVDDILLYAKFYSNIGILEKAAVYTILKRHSWGSWDEFEELFGVPIRIAKVASQSETVKNEVAGWLEEMGSAPYGVFPIGTEIDIKENSKADSFNVFYQKIQALDKELSKLILHQTMTTENGASKAQGNVHENTLEEVIKSDKKKMLSFLNKRLVPAMRKLGYAIPDNAKITIEKTKDPEKQIKIDGILMANGVVLKQQYMEETYGVEIDYVQSNQQPKTPNNESGKKP